MEKRFKIVKKGEDESNLNYWLKLSYGERLENLEKMRQEVITRFLWYWTKISKSL